jgi:hypothetical protein
MIDVNKITSTLAKLPDAQLQQYAQMHKADPYIMALAMSESNRRKELRSAGQGAQGMQEQPKVVDKMVAEMAAVDPMGNVTGYAGGGYLPEDQGIGRLNAGDMNFAGGGIIAFADGGDVERYQSQGLVQDPELASLLAARERYLRAGSDTSGIDQAIATLQAKPARMAAANRSDLNAAENRILGAENAQDGVVYDPLNGIGVSEPAVLSASPAARVGQTPSPRDDNFRRQIDPRMSGVSATPSISAAPTADTGRKGSGAGSGAAAAGAPKGSASLEALYKKLQPSEAEYAALDAKETGVANALKNLGKSGIDEFEAEEAKRGDVFKGREARLAEQGAKLKDREDKNVGAALFFAGAKMLQTPGGIGRALGAGIEAGGAQYVAGLDKLNAAQERLMDAKDRLEELRVNRDDLTSSERRKLKNQAKQYELEAEKLFLDGAHKKLGYKRDDAKNMFAGITTLLGQETAAGATIEAANIRSRDQKDYLAELRGGSLVEQTRKSIMDNIIKANPYADEPTRQRLYQTEWAKALQSNPALAKYAGVASGGGGASSADPLGLR